MLFHFTTVLKMEKQGLSKIQKTAPTGHAPANTLSQCVLFLRPRRAGWEG